MSTEVEGVQREGPRVDGTPAVAAAPVRTDVGRASGTLARLRTGLPGLGPSERRVAEVLLARRDEVVDWSTAELARTAEASPATVVRACQRLGYRGFQHLRLELARTVPEQPDRRDDLLSVLYGEAVDALRVSRDSVDGAALACVVEVLAAAPRVVVVGTGFSAPPVQEAAMRFATAGRPVEAPADVLAQQFAARSLGPGDVCLAVSYSGANMHTMHAVAAAREGGATVVAVTSFSQSPLVRVATTALVTGVVSRSHAVDPMLGRLGHSLVLHALSAGLAARQQDPVATAERMRGVVADALTDG